MDGKLLAVAREEKENIRRQAVREDRRRRAEVYAKIPALRQVDSQLTALVARTAAAAMGGGQRLDELRRESLELQARRAELLVEGGWPLDWLDGAWRCPKCRDTGYVEGRMCSCLTELYRQAQTRELSALMKLGSESFDTFDLSLYDSTPDPVSGVAPRTQMEMVFGVCCDYARGFAKSRMNLLFRGGTGLGKTFLSACIAREVAGQGYSVVYETAGAAADAFEKERRFTRDEDTDAAHALVRRMTECDLLILDDLGTENLSESVRSGLYALVNSRLTARRRTVISTNLTAGEMARRYSPQLMSRLEGEYQVLAFVGTDIRILKKERGLE